MTTGAMAIADKERLALGVRRWYGRIWDFARRKPLGAAGATFIIVMGVAAIFADLSPYGPLQQDLDRIREGPTFAHPFGTDELGRDLLTRVIFGARVTFKIGFLGILIGATAGATIGVVSGYFRGKLDMVLQRVVDAVMAFPALILALALISIREPSDVNTLIIIGIVFTPTSSRVVRGATMSVKQNVYIEASRALGAGDLRIIFRHVVPNIAAPIIVLVSVFLGSAIIVEASLSFLGVAGSIERPTWGGMIAGPGRSYLETAWWLAVFPGLALAGAIYSLNLFGDALRDVLDPRLRGGGGGRGFRA